jgi:hypothetical protein
MIEYDDTDPEAERALIEMLRRTPTWKRAEQLAGLTTPAARGRGARLRLGS